jgi:NADH:ubiquinone oxidoreductase subunit C
MSNILWSVKSTLIEKLYIKYYLYSKIIFFFYKTYLKFINYINFTSYFYIHICAKIKTFIFLVSFLKLKSFFQINLLTDICTVDYPKNKYRFNIIYNFLSIFYNTRLIISLFVKDLSIILSLSKIFQSANWLEREVWDLFGIFFYNHKDLRRILTDYSFKGHPLRKDFPLTGYFELYHDDRKRTLSYSKINLIQEFRTFNYFKNWKF